MSTVWLQPQRGCGSAEIVEKTPVGRSRPGALGAVQPLTCMEADATCPAWSKSREMIWEKRVALPFMLVLLLPKASRTV